MMVTRNSGESKSSRPAAKAPAALQASDTHGRFLIWVDKKDRIVHVKLRGVWDLATANEFCEAIIGIGRELGERPWAALADSREFPAQSPDVAHLRKETMTRLCTLGCHKIAVIATSAVYSMQFKRISTDSHVGNGVFTDEKSALDWIREGRDRESKSEPASAILPIDRRRNRLRDR
jgi:hypothetical protein